MPTKAVQQFMLGTVLSNENEARQTLAAMKAAGYDGIELCGFMIHPIGFMVRLLTKAAGMPVGKGGNLDWHALVKEAGLQVVSLHTDLGSLERDAKAVRVDALDGKISWQPIENAQGCNVRYGIAPDKLYQSWLVYEADEVTLSTLMSGQTYYVCVDSFNENGITTGKIIKMEG